MHLLQKLYKGSSANQPSAKQQQQVKKQLNTSVVLPGHIGSRILDLQLEMESKSMTKETAQQLLSLYSEATQFYEARQDPKFKTYKSRMQGLLSNKDIYVIMFGEEKPARLKEKDIQEIKYDAEKRARNDAKQLIEKFKRQKQQQEDLIIKDVCRQKEQINDRIVRRRSCLASKSFLSASLLDTTMQTQPDPEQSKDV